MIIYPHSYDTIKDEIIKTEMRSVIAKNWGLGKWFIAKEHEGNFWVLYYDCYGDYTTVYIR